MPDEITMDFRFGEPQAHTDVQQRHSAQGDTIIWTVPHVELPLLLNGVVVGYAEVHMHAAWAPDGIPDTSFGFTGRVNTAELNRAIAAGRKPLQR